MEPECIANKISGVLTSSSQSSTNSKCEYCAADMPEKTYTSGCVTVTVRPKCECYVLEYEKGRAAQRRLERSLELEKYFSQSEYSIHLEQCTLDNFKLRPGTEESQREAWDFATFLDDRVKSGDGLVILGTYGSGKTHLAAAIYNTAVNRGCPSVFITAPYLMMRLNRTYHDNNENEYDLLGTLMAADLLIIDDLGTEKASEKNTERLFTLLNGRYNAGKSVVITTNLETPEHLMKHLGGRVFDRLLERCRFAVNKASSYRQTMKGGH